MKSSSDWQQIISQQQKSKLSVAEFGVTPLFVPKIKRRFRAIFLLDLFGFLEPVTDTLTSYEV